MGQGFERCMLTNCNFLEEVDPVKTEIQAGDSQKSLPQTLKAKKQRDESLFHLGSLSKNYKNSQDDSFFDLGLNRTRRAGESMDQNNLTKSEIKGVLDDLKKTLVFNETEDDQNNYINDKIDFLLAKLNSNTTGMEFGSYISNRSGNDDDFNVKNIKYQHKNEIIEENGGIEEFENDTSRVENRSIISGYRGADIEGEADEKPRDSNKTFNSEEEDNYEIKVANRNKSRLHTVESNNEPPKKSIYSNVPLMKRISKRLETEKAFAENNLDRNEKISLKFNLTQISEDYLNDRYSIEVYASKSSKLDNFFFLGKTKPQNGKEIKYSELFEVNYLFERLQYLKIVIICTNGNKSDVYLNLSLLIIQKLQDVIVPLEINKNNTVEFSYETSKELMMLEEFKSFPKLLIKLERTTRRDQEPKSTFYLEYNHKSGKPANQLYFKIYRNYINTLMKKQIFESSKISGKSPINFNVASLDKEWIFGFEDELDLNLIFEFIEMDKSVSEFTLSQKEVIDLLTTPFQLISLTSKVKDKNKKVIIEQYAKLKLSYREIPPLRFLDYIFKGLKFSLEFAIDFTSSNGNPLTNPSSLHSIKQNSKNLYEKALFTCGSILSFYDEDQMFPVYGFGGVPDYDIQLSHCFHINNNKVNPKIEGIRGVMKKYKESLKKIKYQDGPTYFHIFLSKILENVIKEKRDSMLIYTIVMVFTDGKIDDMNETKDLLIEASKYGISVIIIGIDGDDVPLKNSREEAIRDMSQFVEFTTFDNNSDKLAENILEIIPEQIENFYKLKGI